MFFRSENSIEGGSWFFSKKNFVADSNEIAVSYCIGCVEFRHRVKVPVIEPHFLAVGVKNMSFFEFFCFFEFL
jgi:hypothetical protein